MEKRDRWYKFCFFFTNLGLFDLDMFVFVSFLFEFWLNREQCRNEETETKKKEALSSLKMLLLCLKGSTFSYIYISSPFRFLITFLFFLGQTPSSSWELRRVELPWELRRVELPRLLCKPTNLYIFQAHNGGNMRYFTISIPPLHKWLVWRLKY